MELAGGRAGSQASHEGPDDASAWLGRVPWWRRGLAAAGLLISLLATAWLIKGGPGGGLGAVPCFVAGIPVFAGPRSFGRVALAVALVLTVLGVLGSLVGFFVYLPAAIVLLLAWLSDPAARPRVATVLAAVDYAIAIAMTVTWVVALHG
jgi:hypothetical protein